MAWTESGIYANVLIGNLSLTALYPNWIGTTGYYMYLANNSDTPNFQNSAATSIYSATNEVHDSSAWPAGGVQFTALAAGSTSLAPNWTLTGTPPATTMHYKATNVSVASTTLASPGTYGGYFYINSGTKYQWIAIYWGGTGYITTAGTFAVTWSGGDVATFAVAA